MKYSHPHTVLSHVERDVWLPTLAIHNQVRQFALKAAPRSWMVRIIALFNPCLAKQLHEPSFSETLALLTEMEHQGRVMRRHYQGTNQLEWKRVGPVACKPYKKYPAAA